MFVCIFIAYILHFNSHLYGFLISKSYFGILYDINLSILYVKDVLCVSLNSFKNNVILRNTISSLFSNLFCNMLIYATHFANHFY